MKINATVAAISSSRNLTASDDQLNKSLEKASSALRAHRAADDASSLSIAEGLRAEIRGTTQAQRNAQDGISYLQTTEGALTEVHSVLLRIRELAAQATTGSSADRTPTVQREVDTLINDIRMIGDRTTFSGNRVFADYSTSNLAFHVGTQNSDVLTAITQNFTLDPAGRGVFSAELSADLGSPASAADALSTVETAITDVSKVRGTLAAAQLRLENTMVNLGVAVENLTASESRIRDVDVAEEMVGTTRTLIRDHGATAQQAQATTAPQSILLLLQG